MVEDAMMMITSLGTKSLVPNSGNEVGDGTSGTMNAARTAGDHFWYYVPLFLHIAAPT
jgi:hypothetical protein